ncbi:MAG: hypothetical protein RMI34_10070 [Chloroherpetonaceae bacterium]|nr:hypothetical protein [Chloroherpetonaceae bacterium]MDW8020406.1 hypothetical protein [Chloroherpetonaceae bacterium]MDW8465772.1 hypothetical protein [Chloroherpetonaceae bacterium]
MARGATDWEKFVTPKNSARVTGGNLENAECPKTANQVLISTDVG